MGKGGARGWVLGAGALVLGAEGWAPGAALGRDSRLEIQDSRRTEFRIQNPEGRIKNPEVRMKNKKGLGSSEPLIFAVDC
jgi:hypothetical protein